MRKAFFFLSILNDADIEWLAAHGKRKFAPAGTSVITQGESIDAISFLLEGCLSVTVRGSPKPIATLNPGEVVGEISFVDSRPPSASVTAIENSHLLQLPLVAVRNKLNQDAGFAARFYRAIATYLANRLRATSRMLGYGTGQELEADELDESLLDNASIGGVRFDDFLRRVRRSDLGATGMN
ncbi:MAG TPA: cyclic nucleotide-binding domain-containing protein [Bryobacteraceae bacterium]|nr:cyclic nucleotide-binding domain-containing protein [Bryobacteraceae bacterium]